MDTESSLQATVRSVTIQKNNKKMLKTSIFYWIASSKLTVLPRNDG
ncbi:hypothetical protein RAMDARK_0192 [Rickettsia amblyommatis str. Darkwater]|nr:hypothetical protein RAMDARK_0192 [Rickettsia amblyommatis str. Darkwater]